MQKSRQDNDLKFTFSSSFYSQAQNVVFDFLKKTRYDLKILYDLFIAC